MPLQRIWKKCHSWGNSRLSVLACFLTTIFLYQVLINVSSTSKGTLEKLYIQYLYSKNSSISEKNFSEKLPIRSETKNPNGFLNEMLTNIESYKTTVSSKKSGHSICMNSGANSVYKNMTKRIDITDRYVNMSEYFVDLSSRLSCFKEGTDLAQTKVANLPMCVCKKYFFGKDCSVPAAVWYSNDYESHALSIKRRKTPRRVINGLPFHHEFALLEARLNELKDSVDVFIILESQFTNFGDRKPLKLQDRLLTGGYISEFKHKILHVYLDTLPQSPKNNGPEIERLLRCYLSKQGLARIDGSLNDDIFLLSDADEIPTADVVNFLKIHDGYPRVIKLNLRWNVFGFFWEVVNDFNVIRTTTVNAVSTLNFLNDQLLGDAWQLRGNNRELSWTLGTSQYYAGWHCSWCFSPEDIVLKMNSAQSDDPPRLGDDPERKNLTFIRKCIREGRYFYPSPPMKPCNKDDYMFAPRYLTENSEKFRNILTHPDYPETSLQTTSVKEKNSTSRKERRHRRSFVTAVEV